MNLINRMMSYDKTKVKQESCNCVENQIVDYSSLTEEEIERIINERYSDKNEKVKTFIRKALRKHGDKYDYSNVIYINNRTNVEIICRVECHGSFWQTPSHHLRGQGCSICRGCQKLTTEKFIEKSNNVHGIGTYDYSKVKYINSHTKVEIICPKEGHGSFWQTPNSHLNGNGCSSCSGNKKSTTEEFIEKANEVHGKGTYNYSKVKYINNYTEVIIICPIHGDFKQTPTNHLKGEGCPICADKKRIESKTSNLEEFINKANEKHGIGTYNYSESNYINAKTPIKIICQKHGEFWQTPYAHLQGEGCPTCSESKGERKIRLFLIEHNIEFEREKRFNDCRDSLPLPFDFYIPQYNLCIEFDGVQHFVPWSFTHKSTEKERLKNLKKVQSRDEIKTEYCKNKGINLLRLNNIKTVDKKLTDYFIKNALF